MKRILCVDDEPGIRDIMKDYFTALKFSIDVAEEGNEALLRMENESYDLMITDINMPNGMGGIELIQKVSEKNPLIHIIAISGYLKNSEHLNKLPKETIYFEKPVKIKMLSEMVKGILNQQETVK